MNNKVSKVQILGVVALVLAIVVLVAGIYTGSAKNGDGAYAVLLREARDKKLMIDDVGKAGRNATSVSNQAASAEARIDAAAEDTADAAAAADVLDIAIADGTETGDVDVDILLAALTLIDGGIDELYAQDIDTAEIAAGADMLNELTDEKVLALYHACVDKAYTAVNGTESAIAGVRDGAMKVLDYARVEVEPLPEITFTELPVCATVEECHAAIEMLCARAEELDAYKADLPVWADMA